MNGHHWQNQFNRYDRHFFIKIYSKHKKIPLNRNVYSIKTLALTLRTAYCGTSPAHPKISSYLRNACQSTTSLCPLGVPHGDRETHFLQFTLKSLGHWTLFSKFQSVSIQTRLSLGQPCDGPCLAHLGKRCAPPPGTGAARCLTPLDVRWAGVC